MSNMIFLKSNNSVTNIFLSDYDKMKLFDYKISVKATRKKNAYNTKGNTNLNKLKNFI